MATTTISGSGTRVRGTILGAGNVAGSNFKTLSLPSNAIDAVTKFTTIYPSYKTGVESILKGNAVTLVTQTAQSSSTGYVLITKTSHGLAVGDLLVVYGQVPTTYNTVHRVTSVVSSSTVQTDVRYVADSTTAGSYKVFSGDFAKMTKGRYVGRIIGTHIAGSTTSLMRTPASDFFKFPIPVAKGSRRYNITSWDYVTGAATKGANAGDLTKYHDIANNNDTLASEALPTRAVPGELQYMVTGNTATMADYSQKNG